MTDISQENEITGRSGGHYCRLPILPAFRKMTRWAGISMNTAAFWSRSASIAMVCTLLIVLSALQSARAETIGIGRKVSVRAGSIIDGDSIMVKKDNQDIEVRLFGIDAPEFDQPGSAAARRHVAALVKDRELLLVVMDHDAYGRTVALVNAGAVSINEEQVRNGHAWVHPRYCRIRICDRWRDLEQQACSRNVGLWRQSRPIPPWRWKAQKAARR